MRIQPIACVFSTLCMLVSISSASADSSAGTVTTVAVPGGGKPVVARSDKDGAVHLLFDTEEGPKYAKSTDGGATFSVIMPVVHGGSQASGLEYSAWDMAVGKGGRVHVAMGTNA